MDLVFYVRVRRCEKRVTGKQPLLLPEATTIFLRKTRKNRTPFTIDYVLDIFPSILCSYNLFA